MEPKFNEGGEISRRDFLKKIPAGAAIAGVAAFGVYTGLEERKKEKAELRNKKLALFQDFVEFRVKQIVYRIQEGDDMSNEIQDLINILGDAEKDKDIDHEDYLSLYNFIPRNIQDLVSSNH